MNTILRFLNAIIIKKKTLLANGSKRKHCFYNLNPENISNIFLGFSKKKRKEMFFGIMSGFDVFIIRFRLRSHIFADEEAFFTVNTTYFH